MGKTFTWQVKIEYMLQASRDEARKVLEEATPEDVPMLRTLARKIRAEGNKLCCKQLLTLRLIWFDLVCGRLSHLSPRGLLFLLSKPVEKRRACEGLSDKLAQRSHSAR